MKVKAVYDFLDYIAPFSAAAEWDNTGLSVGSFNADVSKILVALDVTEDVINTALKLGAQLVVTHHPLIFSAPKAIVSESLLYKAISSGITFISAHTNLDKAFGGVNSQLALKVGIRDFYVSEYDEFLNIGTLDTALSPSEFAALLKEKLGGSVRYNDDGGTVKKIAFCSGAGGEYASLAAKCGCDALLTGDASHHHFLDAKEAGISLFAAGHYETENPVTEFLYAALCEQYTGELEIVKYEGISPVITL